MKTILIAISSLLSLHFCAQYSNEVGIYIGGSNYLGEMGGNDKTRRGFIMDMKLEQTDLSFGTFFRHRFNNTFGVTTSLVYGRFSGDDGTSSNIGRQGRNLSFTNNVTELAGRLDYYFYNTYDLGGKGRYLLDFRPYAFGGVGVFHHNPKAEYNGEVYALRPLKTEGQDQEYSKISISVPMGVGFFLTYNKRYRISCELGWRKTFTDYLDDVSTTYASAEDLGSELAVALANRHGEIEESGNIAHESNYLPGNVRGNESNNDSYLMAHLGMSYVLRGAPVVHVITRGGHIPSFRSTRVSF